MIAAGRTGWRVAGLLAYLFGPGRHEEHQDPRVIAGSDSPAILEAAPGELGPLVRYLSRGVAQVGLPTQAPRPGSRWHGQHGYVWHVSVRLAPDDPVQSDARWAAIANHLMRRTGVQDAGCRWVAVRHGDDHIHLAAVLVHRERGQWRRFHPRWWKRSLRAACRELEDNLGLTVTADADHTATPAPTRGEQAKAARLRLPLPPRVNLREVVTNAAANSTSPAGFWEALHGYGLRTRFHEDADGTIRGYAIAFPAGVTRDREPVFYTGSSLAPELSWPNLLRRWNHCANVDHPLPVRDHDIRVALTRELAAAATDASERMCALHATDRSPQQDAELDGLGDVTSHLVQVFAARTEAPIIAWPPDSQPPPRPLLAAAEQCARATRVPRGPGPPPPQLRWSAVSDRLRRATLNLDRIGYARKTALDPSAQQAHAQFILALAGLVAELAAGLEQRHAITQARAAHQAANALADVVPTITPPPAPSRPATTQQRPVITPRPRHLQLPSVSGRQPGRHR